MEAAKVAPGAIVIVTLTVATRSPSAEQGQLQYAYRSIRGATCVEPETC